MSIDLIVGFTIHPVLAMIVLVLGVCLIIPLELSVLIFLCISPEAQWLLGHEKNYNSRTETYPKKLKLLGLRFENYS